MPAQGLNPNECLEWRFSFLVPNERLSYRFSKALSTITLKRSSIELISHSHYGEERTAPDGHRYKPIIQNLLVHDALKPAEAANVIAETCRIASEHNVEFFGVGCGRIVINHNWESCKWLKLNDARWLTRHFDDTGQHGPVHYIFAAAVPEAHPLHTLLTNQGFITKQIGSLLLARIPGTGTDEDVSDRYTQVEAAAKSVSAAILGMNFHGAEVDW